MILAGDVGGTKTVLALYETGVNSLEKVREATYGSSQFASLEEMVHRFISSGPRTDLRVVCMGVPGAVIEGTCKTTNLPWHLDEKSLAEAAGAHRGKLINDLEAAALGILHLDDSELATINPTSRRPGNIAVIAAGTGLGEAFLVWDGNSHRAVASEGGHSSFAPQNDLEIGLLQYLQKKHAGHVSWERVLSGPGLGSVYTYLRDVVGEKESSRVADKVAMHDIGSVVGLEGTNGTDPLCEHALDLFASMYGSEAGNLALKGLAVGGVFIGGGIAPKILPALKKGGFMRAFTDKGRFADLLRSIPVNVALNAKAPLIGAAQHARTLV
jgi:glucokinase